jgi:CheY-like chemotaxis protein
MGARILIIEDDAPSMELVRYLLEAAGHTTLCAVDGGTGVRMALDEQPDLVLCDLQMPVMNGYQVARSLREYPVWRQVPIIAVTAFSMHGDRAKALAGGFNEHISKPIAPGQFVAQVESLLPPALHGTAARPG